MKRQAYRNWINCIAGTVLLAASLAVDAAETARTQLRVALFPYIPDAAGDNFKVLATRLEDTFEKRNSGVDLILRPMNKSEDFYDVEMLKGWLSSSSPDGYDVVEVDTVVLGDLASAGVVMPWAAPDNMKDWHPAASKAVRLNDAIYGIPHLLCGHFIITRAAIVANAKNVDQLSAALKSLPAGKSLLVGDLVGSWNLPSLYLDAWKDSHIGSSSAYALHTSANSEVLKDFKTFSSLCAFDGKNACLDGTYDDNTVDEGQFARGEAHALVGYSESLYEIAVLQPSDTSIRITSAQMGRGKYPLLFTDAFVLRRGATSDVQSAAKAFATFMTSSEIQAMLATSGDVSGTATPRYILPATMSAFDVPAMRKNRLYQSLRRAISQAAPFPNTGFLNTRKALRDEIKEAVEK